MSKIIINKKHFVIFWTTTHTRVQSHKKADNETSAKWKEVKGKPNKINELIHVLFYNKILHKKMSLKNPKTLRKC